MDLGVTHWVLGVFGVGVSKGRRSSTLQRILDAEEIDGSVPKEVRWPEEFNAQLAALRPTLRAGAREHGGGTRITPQPQRTKTEAINDELLDVIEARRQEAAAMRAKVERFRMGLYTDDEREERDAWFEAEDAKRRARLRAEAAPYWPKHETQPAWVEPEPEPEEQPPPDEPPEEDQQQEGNADANAEPAVSSGEPPAEQSIVPSLEPTPHQEANARRQDTEEYRRAEHMASQVIETRAEAGAAMDRLGMVLQAGLEAVAAWRFMAPWSSNADGADDDTALRKEAVARTDPAWRGCGRRPGIEIWRVEQHKVLPLPTKDAGQFYEGNSYIVLHTQDREADDGARTSARHGAAPSTSPEAPAVAPAPAP